MISTEMTLYVLDFGKADISSGSAIIIKHFQQIVSLKISGDKELLNFGGPVEYYRETFETTGRNWFCLDAAGRNYGTSPYGVYVWRNDVQQFLKSDRQGRK